MIPIYRLDDAILVDAYHEFSHPFEMINGIIGVAWRQIFPRISGRTSYPSDAQDDREWVVKEMSVLVWNGQRLLISPGSNMTFYPGRITTVRLCLFYLTARLAW